MMTRIRLMSALCCVLIAGCNVNVDETKAMSGVGQLLAGDHDLVALENVLGTVPDSAFFRVDRAAPGAAPAEPVVRFAWVRDDAGEVMMCALPLSRVRLVVDPNMTVPPHCRFRWRVPTGDIRDWQSQIVYVKLFLKQPCVSDFMGTADTAPAVIKK